MYIDLIIQKFKNCFIQKL